jgi:hypothetical protein
MPLQLDPSAQSFYALIDPKYRQPASEQFGLRSHLCLEGVQRVERGFDKETLHWGSLAVPLELHDQFQNNVAKAAISGAKLYLHEERTMIFPLYYEMDLDLTTEPHQFRFATEVILSGVPQEMSEDVRIEKCMRFSKFPPPLANDRINNKLPKERETRWWDVIQAIHDVCVEYNEVPRLPAQVARFICVFLHIAFVREIQKVVASFYPESLTKEKGIGKLTMGILVNHGPLVYQSPEVNVKTGVSTYKMGAHYYMSGWSVTQTQALWIMESTMWALKARFPGKPEEFWRKMIDIAGLTANTGGMRMPYSRKTKKCNVCTKGSGISRAQASGGPCLHCGGGGKVSVDRYYGPGALIIGNGKFHPHNRAWHRFHRIPAHVLRICSVRTTDTAPIPDFNSKSKPEPVLKHDPYKQLVSAIGEGAADRKRKRICDTLQAEEDDPRVSETLRIHNQFSAFDRGETPSTRYRVELVKGDLRRDAVEQILPELLGTLLHPCFDAPLDGACIVHEAGEDSAPSYIMAFPKRKSSADGRCFNRIADRGSGPGMHSRKCTYFKFLREDAKGTGMPVVMQLCRNDNPKPSTRSSQKPCCVFRGLKGAKKPNKDTVWGGKIMVVPPDKKNPAEVLQKIRNCFFLPKDQTAEKSSAMAEVETARAMQRYAGGVPKTPLCGPDLTYNYAISKLVKEDQDKQEVHRKLMAQVTASTTTGSDGTARRMSEDEGSFAGGDYLGY